jgi:hypothetical protein
VRLLSITLGFRAIGPISFAAGKPANGLRGAFGAMLKRSSCPPDCPGARLCPKAATCDYARIFEPTAAPGAGPSGFANPPRPFVFRAAHLDGRNVEPGDSFHFDLNVFDMRRPLTARYTATFARIAEEQGFGPGRGRAVLEFTEAKEVCVPLDRRDKPVSHAVVEFRTPTELKISNGLAAQPDFPILFARIRDRIAGLSASYGDGPLVLDFKAMGERAGRVATARCAMRHAGVFRTSARTGQRHPLGGFTGTAEYEGDLTEFIPFLEAAAYTGVGRQTTWGKGEIRTLCRD